MTIALEPVPAAGSRRESDRIALVTFAAVEAVAFLVIVRLARVQWFFLDEWDFLAQRKAGDLGDLFRPHNGQHWATLPILAYRLLWWMATQTCSSSTERGHSIVATLRACWPDWQH